ncbi:SIS domain-containing protein [Herbiconiux sp. P15]|uniref:SIS domain-containing protein n=1 Tax=Herbiconiux liukaitaii TaxID=3342799 RepID=UPI0035BA2492
MDTARFRDDLNEIPAALERLADAFEAGLEPLGRAQLLLAAPGTRVLVLGMGSSAYAADVVARRARVEGRMVVSELASAVALPAPAEDLVVVAVSATGGSAEVLAAVERYRGAGRLIAVTNRAESRLAQVADLVVPLVAGDEVSGVSCRTFRHTFLVLDALFGLAGAATGFGILAPGTGASGAGLSGDGASAAGLSVNGAYAAGVQESGIGSGSASASLARECARSAAALLEAAPSWIDEATHHLLGPQGTWVLAPVERLSSAQQSSLMMREVPRRPAYASETGDWSHVDVYLSKTLDYRALLFAGSAWDEQAAEWMRGRSATLVTVGPTPLESEAALSIRYPGDDRPEIALIVETLVGELLAASWHEADPTYAWSPSLT